MKLWHRRKVFVFTRIVEILIDLTTSLEPNKKGAFAGASFVDEGGLIVDYWLTGILIIFF